MQCCLLRVNSPGLSWFCGCFSCCSPRRIVCRLGTSFLGWSWIWRMFHLKTCCFKNDGKEIFNCIIEIFCHRTLLSFRLEVSFLNFLKFIFFWWGSESVPAPTVDFQLASCISFLLSLFSFSFPQKRCLERYTHFYLIWWQQSYWLKYWSWYFWYGGGLWQMKSGSWLNSSTGISGQVWNADCLLNYGPILKCIAKSVLACFWPISCWASPWVSIFSWGQTLVCLWWVVSKIRKDCRWVHSYLAACVAWPIQKSLL